VDAAPIDGSDPLENARVAAAEVLEYSEALAERPTWLVLNKADLLSEEAVADLRVRFEDAFPGDRLFVISAATGAGLGALVDALTEEIAEMRARLEQDEAYADAQAELEARINEDVLASALNVRPPRIAGAGVVPPSDDDEAGDRDDDDEGPEVVYVHE
jgi:GTP-binding protein